MKKGDITTPKNYFNRYIDLIDDMPLEAAFELSLAEIDQIDLKKWQNLGDATYAEGKWTIKQIMQHLLDWERIMSYRALIFARGAAENSLPGHDEDEMARAAGLLDDRSLEQILDEMRLVRRGTASLFSTFDDSAMLRKGLTGAGEMSALAFAFTILGHQRHHFQVIEERYF